MITLISHRGNIDGPDSWNENKPSYIEAALNSGFNVEVDVWYDVNVGRFFLGHDYKQFETTVDLLLDRRVWSHAKNEAAFVKLRDLDANVFWLKDDGITITHHAYVWTDTMNISNYIRTSDTVFVDLDGKKTLEFFQSTGYTLLNDQQKSRYNFLVCSDYVDRLQKLMNEK